ncbi:MAG: YcbK family protein, partial [Burkholderiales bacterium]|nr:YcbK family protein [Burkholderiales bacterium]
MSAALRTRNNVFSGLALDRCADRRGDSGWIDAQARRAEARHLVLQPDGKAMVVTSGYRNPERNRRARGAKNSLHMYCAAADVQVPGVSKWELAKFVRSMPGRGGVGTYCHTESVHIDVGPERDWNWR